MRDFRRLFTLLLFFCFQFSLSAFDLESSYCFDKTLVSTESLTQSDTGFMVIGHKGVSAKIESAKEGLGKTIFVKANPGDTLLLPNVVPVKNPSFVLACCGEAGYLLDSIYGLYVIIPSFVELNETYTISFEGSLKRNLPSVSFFAFNRVVENRLVFSRSMELRMENRLDNGAIEYALAEDGMPVFRRYTRPLLISKSTIVYARVRLDDGTCQGYSKIQLERSNDIISIECEANPIPVEENEGITKSFLSRVELLNLVLCDSAFLFENQVSACWFEKEITLRLDRATLKPFKGMDLYFQIGKGEEDVERVSFYSDGKQIKGSYSFSRINDLLKVSFTPECNIDVRTLHVRISQSFWQRLIGEKGYFRIVGLYVKPLTVNEIRR